MSTEQHNAGNDAYHVRWSKEDGEYVATTDSFPSLSWLDPSPVGALAGLLHVMPKKENPDA